MACTPPSEVHAAGLCLLIRIHPQKRLWLELAAGTRVFGGTHRETSRIAHHCHVNIIAVVLGAKLQGLIMRTDSSAQLGAMTTLTKAVCATAYVRWQVG